MSPSSTPMMQSPHPMKKKVLSALVAVVIGHIGVLWAVSQMESPELKPIDKEPLKVRFVKIQEPQNLYRHNQKQNQNRHSLSHQKSKK